MNTDEVEKEFRDNFEQIYLSHSPGMVRFAMEYVSSMEEAENIVHDAFAEVWEVRRNCLNRKNYLLAFLFTAIKNRCVDWLRHRIVMREAEDTLQEEYRLSMQMKFNSLEVFDQDVFASGESVEALVNRAIQSLPEKCREIFIKSKLEGMKQSQIAEELHISIHTVETQMGIAYRKLKEELKNCFPLFLFILYF
ncbi:MAG: RNA polymerase sigma-70 factor [Tannerella sp.]|jgi:RNA polymerase sigma-70 factor (ECF subfamily)|nr:RNA polymerase sigma-70 factor [Tannerella sp.]